MSSKSSTLLYVALGGAALYFYMRSTGAISGTSATSPLITQAQYAAMTPAQQAAYAAAHSTPANSVAGTIGNVSATVGLATAGVGLVSKLTSLFTAGNSSPATSVQQAQAVANAANQMSNLSSTPGDVFTNFSTVDLASGAGSLFGGSLMTTQMTFPADTQLAQDAGLYAPNFTDTLPSPDLMPSDYTMTLP